MIDVASGDFIFSDGEGIAAGDFHKFLFGGHRGHVDGKIRSSHLGFEYLFQAVAAKVLRTKTIKMKSVVFGIQRRKERHTLNVVPVVMRDQNVRLWIAHTGCNHACGRRGPAAAQYAKAGAAIENKLCAVRRGEFKTRRVSAIAPGGGIHGRRGTAHSPEAQLGDRTAHRLFKTPEAVRLNRRAAVATVPGEFAPQNLRYTCRHARVL